MASTFMGVAIANTGLNASQVGLATTTNNISNMNTTGYSRQLVSQVSIGPAAVYSSSYVGNGTEVTSVDRVSSFRLNQKYWSQNGDLGYWDTMSSYLEEIETSAFDISDEDTSFTDMLDTFYSDLETLSTDPSDESNRTVVVEDAQNICSYLNTMSSNLSDLRSDINTEVKTTVDQINSYAKQIASLNNQIQIAATSGASTNELEDQRDVLIDELSSLTDISVSEITVGTMADGSDLTTYNITINGSALVSGSNYNQLETYTISDGSDQDGMYGIRWADTGDELDAGDTGALAAYLDLRDGDSADNKGIVYYMNQLDEFAQTFAEAFNEGLDADSADGHAEGYGLDGSTGTRFFTYADSSGNAVSSDDFVSGGLDYSLITAANISVSSTVQEDTDKIATSDTAGEEDNNIIIDKLINICEEGAMFGTSGTAEDFYGSILSTLGTAASYADTQDTIQQNITDYIDDCRSSVSGVSTDEETANLTVYQQAYEASAAALSTWSEIYEVTINMVNVD